MKPKTAVSFTNDYTEESVRRGIQRLCELLDLDPENPFKDMISPGDRVFVKPNWVTDTYRQSCSKKASIWTTITHPQVIHETVRLVDRAMNGHGLISVGDCPSIDADFARLVSISQMKEMISETNTPVEVLDLRPLVCDDLRNYGVKNKMLPQTGDPRGTSEIDLGERSMFRGCDPSLFRGIFDDTSETIASHSNGRHLYSFARSIVDADLVISIPKMKTHHKVGVTLNLKGLVGTIVNKNQLVHWRNGYPEIGGDEYPDRETWHNMQGKALQKRGAWMGNDTIWRMVCDLHLGFESLRNDRPNFSIIDGVVGGQGEGPFCPDPKSSKVFVASRDFLAADVVGAQVMGFDVSKVPYLRESLITQDFEASDIEVVGMSALADSGVTSTSLDFAPPIAWSSAKARREFHND